MKKIAMTIDGIVIMTGIYDLYETYGLQFEILFPALKSYGLMPSWLDLYSDMRLANIKHNRILGRISQPIIDTYGKECRDHVFDILIAFEEFDAIRTYAIVKSLWASCPVI